MFKVKVVHLHPREIVLNCFLVVVVLLLPIVALSLGFVGTMCRKVKQMCVTQVSAPIKSDRKTLAVVEG